MDSDVNNNLHGTVSTTTTTTSATLSRKPSALRLKPNKQRSNGSLKSSVPATPSDDQSLISFPSLSPSLETSPEYFNARSLQQGLHTALTDNVSHDTLQAVPTAVNVFDELLSPTTAPSDNSALFDDVPRAIRDVPGTLHHQTDEHVERLIARTGAVALVKQLAQDLAERDEQMTLLQRRAEERETLLRKMLRECEISNLDIENRFRELRKLKHDQARNRTGQLNRFNTERSVNGTGTHPEASLGERLAEAFQDSIRLGEKTPVPRVRQPSEDVQDDFETPRPPRKPSVQSTDTNSVASDASAQGGRLGTVRGWREYFKSAAENPDSATSSGILQLDGHQTRGGDLQGPLLRQPIPDSDNLPRSLSRSTSQASIKQDLSNAYRDQIPITAESESTSSNRSVAGWVTRLVAGGAKHGTRSGRNRASSLSTPDSTNLKGDRSGSQYRNHLNTVAGNRHSSATSALNHSATVRRIPKDNTRPSVINLGQATSPEPSSGDSVNFGPVEMDTIVSDEKRPPTLIQYNNYGSSADYLTDRFGFIYDQRRRKRQHEAAAALPLSKRAELAEAFLRVSNATSRKEDDSRSARSRSSSIQNGSRPETPLSLQGQSTEQPGKRWQDYLTLTSLRTELLSHTPYAAPITDVMTAEQRPTPPLSTRPSQLIIPKSGSGSASTTNAAPSPTRIVSETAELAIPAVATERINVLNLSSAFPTVDPVKALLDQVNEVHDSLQREKTTRWNEFLRKVRAERHRDKEALVASGNRQASKITPETLLADGEFIGVAGLGVKGKVGRAKGNEFRNLVLNGIPVAYRAKIWAECCGASSLRIPGYYDELVTANFTDVAIAQQIQMDITRTLTDNIFFRKGQGVAKLNEVLLAYACRNPDVGYCQGMNLITANLLLIMPTAEDAFWILTSIVENILPEKYYDSSLAASRADQVVLRQYVEELLPQLSGHFEALGIDLEAVTFQWFLSVFTDCLSAEALFRVWDVVLCLNDGATFLFQIALALLKLNEKSLLACDSPAEVYGYINQKMTDHAISIDGLIRASEELKKEVKREDVIERRDRVVQLEEETIRERERARKGKGRANGSANGTPDMNGDERPKTTNGHATTSGTKKNRGLAINTSSAVGSASSTAPSTPLRRHASATIKTLSGKSSRANLGRTSYDSQSSIHDRDDTGYGGWTGELQVRTPMPIDEEIQFLRGG